MGSLVGQIAKLRGAARVIGSAGSRGQGRAADGELGFDAAFDYHDGPVRRLAAGGRAGRHRRLLRQRRRRPPGGGASAAEPARPGRALRHDLRSTTSTEPPAAPRNLALVIGKRLTLRGFLVSDHSDLRAAVRREVGRLAARGPAVRYDETIVDGIENAPDAFLGLLRGDNLGKMLVKV